MDSLSPSHQPSTTPTVEYPPLPDSPSPSSLACPAPTVSRPPMAAHRLSLVSSNAHRITRPRSSSSPHFLDSLTRALPSSSIDSSAPTYADLVRPTPAKLQRSLSQSSKHSRSKFRTSELSRTVSGGSVSGTRSTRALSFSSDLSSTSVPESDESQVTAQLADLSWGTQWWPFKVIEPASVDKGKTKAADQDEVLEPEADEQPAAPKAQSRSFLEFFAGKGAVGDAKAQQDVVRLADRVEEELLNADLDSLRLASTNPVPSNAPDNPPPLPPKNEAPEDKLSHSSTSPRPVSFLSTNMFSSKPLEGPSSLFSGFSISNPFGTATSSPPLTSPPPSTSPPFSTSPRLPHHGRAYSSGPGTERKHVSKYLDEEDQKTAKVEELDHMDMFTLIKERYKCPKYPIVFCHGLFGFDTIGPVGIKPLQFSYWVGVKEALETIGAEVLIGSVPASAGIEERAKVLCEQIEQAFPGKEVSLIGHSMGGLDARFLISRLKPTTFKVRSLTTIATPHRGSSLSDFLLEDVLGSARVPALKGFLKRIGIPGGGAAFDDLTTTKMERFNAETPDDPSVKYYSYGAEFEPGWSNVFRVSWGIIHDREGPNDGLVSVASSKWGEYKATLTNVNHLDLVGWVGKVRYGWAELLGTPIKFKPVSFYLALAEMLEEEGF